MFCNPISWRGWTLTCNGKMSKDTSLPFFYFFDAYSPLQIQPIKLKEMKRRGSLYSLIPVLRPSHCLTQRISNARSPRQEILYTYANNGADTIHLTRTFRCRISFGFSQSCEVWGPKDNVRKRPFWAKDLRICISYCLEDSIPSMSDLPTQPKELASHWQN